jgi:hypothetical protein
MVKDPDAALSSGTVIFLFTDIQGSTAPWEGTAIEAAVERHLSLLRTRSARRDRGAAETRARDHVARTVRGLTDRTFADQLRNVVPPELRNVRSLLEAKGPEQRPAYVPLELRLH